MTSFILNSNASHDIAINHQYSISGANLRPEIASFMARQTNERLFLIRGFLWLLQRLCNKIRLNRNCFGFYCFWRRKGLRGEWVKEWLSRHIFPRLPSFSIPNETRAQLVFISSLSRGSCSGMSLEKLIPKMFPLGLTSNEQKFAYHPPFSKAVLCMIKRHEARLQRISVNVITGCVHNLNSSKQTMGKTAHGQLKLY